MDFIKKTIYPVLFWVLLFAFMVSSTHFDKPPEFHHHTVMSGTVQAAFATTVFCVLHHINMFLLTQFFAQKHFQNYILSLFLLISAFSMFLYFVVIQQILKEDIPYIAALFNVIMPLLLSSAYYFVRKGFTTQIELNASQAKQLEAEMKLLKMQIQPHFLFNTLNNIYATNLTKHADANEMILQLSEILRFQLESNKKQFIKLTEEIVIIENYVALEKVRLHDCAVTVTKIGNCEGFSILSLLLLPLLENAFKYGKNNIHIRLEMKENTFIFECENEIISNVQHKQSNKIGLANVQKRLELMYAERYSFLAKANDNNVFKVVLQIQL
jgi:two-component system, LytTR family, sensor kinase